MTRKKLTPAEVVSLRREICLGSIFYSDYENSYGIDTHAVCDFFDGYLEYLHEEAREDGINDLWALPLCEQDKYDTPERLINYCGFFEAENWPLLYYCEERQAA